MNNIVERLVAHIEQTRVLLKEYELLTDEQKKGVRNQIYIHTGSFGKAFKEIIDPFKQAELSVATKKSN